MEKTILNAIICTEIAIALIIFIGFGLVLYKASSNLMKVMRGDLISLPKAPLRLTYKIPQAFGRFCEQRDGWKGALPILGKLCVLSFIVWLGTSLFAFRFLNFAPFFITFIGFGVMFSGMWFFTNEYDSSITFYAEGIGNRPKGGRTPYSFYTKAVIEKVHFENWRFQVITFIPKHKAWLAETDEYGFDVSDDITPLIDLLKKQGLPVEEINESARFASLR